MSRNGILIGTLGQRPGAGGGGGANRNIISTQAIPPIVDDLGTAFANLSLPTTAVALLDDATSTVLPVTWLSAGYDSDTPGPYTLTGQFTLPLPATITNSTNVVASILVTIRPLEAFDVYVETTGNDTTGDGTSALPYLTVQKGVTVATALGGNRTVHVGAGTFTLTSYLILPATVSITGTGKLATFITGAVGLNYSADVTLSQWGLDKYLIQMTSVSSTDTVQVLRDFTLTGNAKALHGGIYINNRDFVTVRDIRLTAFNFAALYHTNTDALLLQDVSSDDSALSHSNTTTGAIMMGSNTNSIYTRVFVSEGEGYALKLFGPPPTVSVVHNFRAVNSSFSVTPDVSYDGALSNRAVELSGGNLSEVQFDNCVFENTLFVRTPTSQTSGYNSSARVLYCVDCEFDLVTRAAGKGYSIQADCHNIEIADCWFTGGGDTIVANNSADVGQVAKRNWYIYGNIFYGQQTLLSAAIVKSVYVPLADLRFYNNTVDIAQNNPIFIFQTLNGQLNTNWTLRNNLINDRSTADGTLAQGGPNTFIKLDGGGSITNLIVSHSIIFGMPQGAIPGGSYTNIITVSPQLLLSSFQPDPYYRPLQSSPAIFAGTNVGLPFTGAAPTIGGYEATPFTIFPIISIVQPTDIEVLTGTDLVDVGLPATISVTLQDSSTRNLAVVWSTGSYNGNVEAIYPLTGVLTLPPEVSNPSNFIPAISVIVINGDIVFFDTFDRVATTPGASYTTEGTQTFVLNGTQMDIDGADGSLTDRVAINTSIVGLNNLRLEMNVNLAELGTTSYGLGFGIQNLTNPDPNKAVLINFWMNSTINPGRLEILGGNGTTSNIGYISRATAPTQIPMVLGHNYKLELIRELFGSDLLWTATVTDTGTLASNTVQWTEVGSESLLYEGTSKVTIWRFGGLQRILDVTIEDLDTESPFPNITSVQAVPTITVANGTLFGTNGIGLGLPATRTVLLSDASTPTYAVTWQQGTYSPTTANTYNLTGILTIPGGVTNIGNLTATASVTVNPPVTGGTSYNWYVGGPGASDANAGTTVGSPFATIQRAANVATAGQTIGIRAGTYRETVTPVNSGTAANPITYAAFAGETVVVSGLNLVGDSGWSVHSGSIYKKTITLPVNGYTQFTTNNTDIVANQIFKDGAMMIEARYPKVANEGELFDQYKRRSAHLGTNLIPHDQFGPSFQPNSITDTVVGTLPNLANNGAKLFIFGWFGAATMSISSHAGNVITFPSYFAGEGNFRKWWYVTNHIGLLTQQREWHYGTGGGGVANTLYFWQPGGGSPTGVEYKARNWSFDLRTRSYITVTGISMVGCEINGNTSTTNVILDNIRAKYTNHFFMTETGGYYWDITRAQSGFRLQGPNNQVINSEFDMGASQCIWLGANGKANNNKITRYGYDSNYGCAIGVWGNVGGIEMGYNTITTMGRSGIDFGYNDYGNKFNLNIHHNDISYTNWLNYDGGHIYTGQHCNTAGTRIHHNWLHHGASQASPTGHRIQGIMSPLYFDQGSGPAMFDHNVSFENFTSMGLVQDTADYYILSRYQNRTDTPGSEVWQNTFWTSGGGNRYSYVTYITTPLDVIKNNIFRDRCAFNWTNVLNQNFNGGLNVFSITNSHIIGSPAGFRGTNYATNASPGFVGTGSTGNGLDFRLTSGSSTASNIGTPRANGGGYTDITSGAAGTIDAGAYEFGDPNPWTAGYVAVPYEAPDPGEPPVDTTPFYFEAEEYDALVGGTDFGTFVGSLVAGSSLRFNVDFGAVTKDLIRVRYARLDASSTTMEVRTGSVVGPLIGTVSLPTTTGTSTYATVEQALSPGITGVTSVFLVFPSGTFATNLDWIEFAVNSSGAGNIATLDTVANFSVPYDTGYGTNGDGLGLPQSVNCTFDGGGAGIVDITWSGTYSRSAAFITDIPYVLTGTPVLTGGITNTDPQLLSVTVTVQDPWTPLANAPFAILDSSGLVISTTNTYGIVNGSSGVTQWSDLSGNTRHFTSSGTAPTLSGGRIVFNGSGFFTELAGSTAFGGFHYNATPGNLKWTIIADINVTSAVGLRGLFGDNGFYSGSRGVVVGADTTGSNTGLIMGVFNGVDAAGAIYLSSNTPMEVNSNHIMTIQLDNSLAAASGKVKFFNGNTSVTATSSGTGVLSATAAPTKWCIGDMGTSGSLDFSGSMKVVVILAGVESGAVLTKLQSDIATYTGTPL